MKTPQDVKAKVTAAYNAAADLYDDPVNSFWDQYGRRTVERLRLEKGSRVLDACCGSGASALPAAESVGPEGYVIGIDLAANLVARARTKARIQSLHNVEFREGDLLDTGFTESSFHAVVCVFGIFFLPDMQAGVRELWRVLRPGGKLAITTWGPRFFEPASTAFWNSVREVRPDLYKGFNPWDIVCDPQSLRNLLSQGGIEQADVAAEAGAHAVPSPDAWWSMVLGTGYRGTVEQLDADDRERVRLANLNYIQTSGLRSVEANVVYAVATKR